MDKDLLAKIKVLREKTGLSIADCKKALIEVQGDEEKAIEYLHKQGVLKAGSKAEREAKEGIVGSYIHQTNKLGVLVEVNCETDFVARTDDFKGLAHDLAMHIAAMNPTYVSTADIPQEVKEEQGDNIDEFYKETCLLNQAFLKDPSKTIEEVIASYIAKFGENIRVGKFARISIG